ncbi:MAG: LD-carboxypeptidase, partial [Methyloligellaceae bacterium]
MTDGRLKIGVVAPGTRIEPALAEKVKETAAAGFPDRAPEIHFHPQCFLSAGHFAGDDAARAQAFAEIANDDSFGALWFARGGYGACRLIDRLLPQLTDAAREKTYLGYSDAGSILAALYGRGFTRLAHGPMPADFSRNGGEAAVTRSLSYLVDGADAALEPTVSPSTRTAAFNITILS